MSIHTDILCRYDAMIAQRDASPPECRPIPGTEPRHLRWMLGEISRQTDDGKSYRWLGFIQGCVIKDGLTTVDAERNFTRTYFSGLRENIPAPESANVLQTATT